MQSGQLWKAFYQKLGHLCYSIAAIDNKVAETEVAELQRIVKEEWLHVEKTQDEFGTDASFQIEIVFDWLRDSAPSSEEAFTEFRDFYQAHPDFFTTSLKQKIGNTAKAIASAFHGANKAEQALFERLENLFAS